MSGLPGLSFRQCKHCRKEGGCHGLQIRCRGFRGITLRRVLKLPIKGSELIDNSAHLGTDG